MFNTIMIKAPATVVISKKIWKKNILIDTGMNTISARGTNLFDNKASPHAIFTTDKKRIKYPF